MLAAMIRFVGIDRVILRIERIAIGALVFVLEKVDPRGT
jgi:hypothetical protein